MISWSTNSTDDRLLLVVNAGTTDKDWDWITSHR